MVKPLTVTVVILVLVLFASETLGLFSSLRLIGSRGTVKVVGVGVYWDANCTSPVYSVDWGSMEPGSVRNVTFFIRNEGNEPALLFLATDNWNPPNASAFITLNWDYIGDLIYPHQTIMVTLTLSIALITDGMKGFSFDIIIGVNEL